MIDCVHLYEGIKVEEIKSYLEDLGHVVTSIDLS